MKLKLNPSDRIKRRYILIEGAGREDVEKVILEYIGILGYAKASPIFVSDGRKELILSIAREALMNVRAALEVSSLKIKIRRVSGTLKGLR